MLPKDFISPFPGLEEALAEEPAVSVRVNRAKGIAVPHGAETVAWCPSGFWLGDRPQFTWDPALHQGLYYVQDASSMITTLAVKQAVSLLGLTSGVLLLDACAAPGGKTIAAIDALPPGSMAVANEYVPGRVAILAENLAKWGSPAKMVTRGDTARFRRLPGTFDIVMADVPCSGEGMFRKDPEAVRQWTPALVEECAARQREIVANLWETLREGGIFIYSTCTFNRTENEDMLAWLLAEYPDGIHIPLDIPDGWGPVTTDGCTHFVPGRVRGEGLTIFMVSKGVPGLGMRQQPSRRASSADRNRKSKKTSAPVSPECFRWLDSGEEYDIRDENGRIVALPTLWSAQVKEMSGKLDVVGCGLELATVKGRDVIPSQSLALSTALRRGAFPEVTVDYAAAVAYLRREAVAMPDGTPRGFVLLTYGGYPLGFVKNIGNRANNLYPAEWRILSTHIPPVPPSVV